MSRKKTKNNYWTEETEQAIIKYNGTDNTELKNVLYREEIEYPINKLSEKTDPRGYKYLYYINLNDEVVEVTSVTNSKNHGTKFNDMHYVGMLKKYHKIEYK